MYTISLRGGQRFFDSSVRHYQQLDRANRRTDTVWLTMLADSKTKRARPAAAHPANRAGSG